MDITTTMTWRGYNLSTVQKADANSAYLLFKEQTRDQIGFLYSQRRLFTILPCGHAHFLKGDYKCLLTATAYVLLLKTIQFKYFFCLFIIKGFRTIAFIFIVTSIKAIVRKPLMIKIIKLRQRNSDNFSFCSFYFSTNIFSSLSEIYTTKEKDTFCRFCDEFL